MITAEQLREAKRLLQQPNGWIKRSFAQDERGHEVGSLDPRAVSFCLYGVVAHVTGLPLGASNYQLIKSCLPDYPSEYDDAIIADFNDRPETTLDQVLGVLDCAIAKVEA